MSIIQLPHEDTNKRNKCRILKRLSQDESPCEEEIFVLRISAIEAHQNHPTGKVKHYIHVLYDEVCSLVYEMFLFKQRTAACDLLILLNSNCICQVNTHYFIYYTNTWPTSSSLNACLPILLIA